MKRMIALLVLGLIIVAGSAGSASATTDLILHLEFEGDFLDSSGNLLHGTPTGDPTFVPDGVDRGYGAGLFGQALKLCDVDSLGDIVTVADHDLLDVASITLMAWVNVTRFGPAGWGGTELFYKPAAPGFPGAFKVEEADNTGVAVFVVETDPWHTGWAVGPNLETGLWHHIAGTYDAGTGVVSWYVDGMLDSTATGLPGPIPATTTDFLIGEACHIVWHDGTQGTVALIDEVRIYNRALTLEEIQAVSKIPEPATMLLLGIGLSGLAFWGKKKRG